MLNDHHGMLSVSLWVDDITSLSSLLLRQHPHNRARYMSGEKC